MRGDAVRTLGRVIANLGTPPWAPRVLKSMGLMDAAATLISTSPGRLQKLKAGVVHAHAGACMAASVNCGRAARRTVWALGSLPPAAAQRGDPRHASRMLTLPPGRCASLALARDPWCMSVLCVVCGVLFQGCNTGET